MSKGPSWRKSVRGFWRAPWVFIVASAVVINLLLMPVSIDTTPTHTAVSVSIHMPQENNALDFLRHVLTSPAGWLLGLFVGPAIHYAVHGRLKQADDHYKRGVKAYKAERLDEAIADLTKALDLSGGEGKLMKWDAHAYAYRAGAYAVLDDIGRAVGDLEKAQSLTRDPDLTAHVQSQLQESREEIGHGGARLTEEALATRRD